MTRQEFVDKYSVEWPDLYSMLANEEEDCSKALKSTVEDLLKSDLQKEKLFKALKILWYQCYGGYNIDYLKYRAAFSLAADTLWQYCTDNNWEMNELWYEAVQKEVNELNIKKEIKEAAVRLVNDLDGIFIGAIANQSKEYLKELL